MVVQDKADSGVSGSVSRLGSGLRGGLVDNRGGSGLVSGSGFINGFGSGLVDYGSGSRLVDNRSGSGLVDRFGGGLVSGLGGGLVRCRVGGFVSLIFGVGSLSFVPDIGNITVGISLVRYNLDTAIGQVDTVFSGGIVVVTALLLAESSTGVGILHSVFVVVHGGKNGVFVVRGGGGVVRGGVVGKGRPGGKSQDSGGGENLKWTQKNLINLEKASGSAAILKSTSLFHYFSKYF